MHAEIRILPHGVPQTVRKLLDRVEALKLAQDKRKRAPKGSVAIGTDRGWLRLYWTLQGKRYYLPLGLPDSRTNRAIAQQRAMLIERDIQYGEFDGTLDKYRGGEDITALTVVDVLEKFIEFKRKTVDPRSLEKYIALQNYVRAFFKTQNAERLSEDRAFQFRDHLCQKLEPITVRERLSLMRSCWRWAIKRKLVQENPWLDVNVKVPPKPRPKPFTEWEVQQIVQGFRSHPVYFYLADMVEFMLSLGCRPGEAFGLKWKHLSNDCATIWIGESWSRGRRKATKNNKARAFTLSPRMQQMLLKRRPHNAKPDDLVFPSREGCPMDDHNFRKRAWTPILKELNIPYRKPYNSRHSFVSHAIAQGLTPSEVTEITGHCEETIFRSYLGNVKGKVQLPDLFNVDDD